jgi:hypothetical protein
MKRLGQRVAIHANGFSPVSAVGADAPLAKAATLRRPSAHAEASTSLTFSIASASWGEVPPPLAFAT